MEVTMKKKIWRFVVASVIVTVPLTFLWGCQVKSEVESISDQEDKIVLKIYAQYADEDTKVPYDYAVEQLKIAYPNVTLELDVQAQDDGQKLQTYAATGNLPDIFQVGRQQIQSFKESGNIMVLNEIAKETGFTDHVFANVKPLLYDDDGNIYAFPYAGNEVVVWYYNKALFKAYDLEVPHTFDELLKVVEVFKANDIIPLACFGREKWITTAFYDVIATRYESEGIEKLDNGEVKALSEGYEKAAEVVSQLADAGLFPEDVTRLNYDQASSLFYEGKAAMMINGQWEMEAAYEKMGNQVGWMYYPSYSEQAYEEGKNNWSGGGNIGGYAVNPNGEHKELAAEVAAFIATKYCEAKYLYRSNPFVTVDLGLDDNSIKNPMMMELMGNMNQQTTTTKFTWGIKSPIFKTTIEDQSQLLLTNQYTAREFIEEINRILK